MEIITIYSYKSCKIALLTQFTVIRKHVWFVDLSLQRPSVQRKHEELCLAAGGLGRGGVLHRWEEIKSCFEHKVVMKTRYFRCASHLSRLTTYWIVVPVLPCWTWSISNRLNHLCSTFLQFRSFSTWIPGLWSRQRLPRCSDVSSELEAENKWHPFECQRPSRASLSRLSPSCRCCQITSLPF